MNPFSEHMAGLNNQQLMQVLVEQKDYVPQALKAAEIEIRSRKVGEEEINLALEEGLKTKQEADFFSDQSLKEPWPLLYFWFAFLSFTPFMVLFYRYHIEKGYHRRSFESMRLVFLGILFYVALGGVLNRFFPFF